ncbi:MAG TPA: DNA gyrase inhibitor YacG [Candidatus Tectomicrobia bacterium]|nr:DNA gyrase inhibitor YacG [Candidatus Tectomicrobia bacterium]
MTRLPARRPSPARRGRPGAGPRCPRCGATVAWQGNADRPFCSRLCRLLDLGAWLDERYRIPDPSAGPDGEADQHVP